MRRLLPFLLAGALAGGAVEWSLAQNLCSPSTLPAIRYAGYPSSMPYSNVSTRITSNCTGPAVDLGITPDPYAGLAFPVPDYSYYLAAPIAAGYGYPPYPAFGTVLGSLLPPVVGYGAYTPYGYPGAGAYGIPLGAYPSWYLPAYQVYPPGTPGQ
ncbi:MAG TPA: hypothetical protein VFB73_03680 [Chloroflexota bacterium]|nr:hypothetical protein [Chloroflexota bacterium]